jgi:hypothetical protein
MSIKEGYNKVTVYISDGTEKAEEQLNQVIEKKIKKPGQEEPYVFKLKKEYSCCENPDYTFYKKHNKGHIEGSLVIEARGGCPPYTWASDTPHLYFQDPADPDDLLDTIITTESFVRVYEADASILGEEIEPFLGGNIEVIDSCGSEVSVWISTCKQDEDEDDGGGGGGFCPEPEWAGNIVLTKTGPFDNYLAIARVENVVDETTLMIQNLRMIIGDMYPAFNEAAGNDPIVVTQSKILRIWLITNQEALTFDVGPVVESKGINSYLAGNVATGSASVIYDNDRIVLDSPHGFEIGENNHPFIVVEFDSYYCDCQKLAIYAVNGGNMPILFQQIGGGNTIIEGLLGSVRHLGTGGNGFEGNTYFTEQHMFVGISHTPVCYDEKGVRCLDSCGFSSNYQPLDKHIDDDSDVTIDIGDDETLGCGERRYYFATGVPMNYCSPTYHFQDDQGAGELYPILQTRTCQDGFLGELSYESHKGAYFVSPPANPCCSGSDVINLEVCSSTPEVQVLDEVRLDYGAVSPLLWPLSNPDTMNATDSIVVEVTGGVGPFTWTLAADKGNSSRSGLTFYTGLVLSDAVTSGRTNTLTSTGACGGADIIVTDSCGFQVKGSVRIPTAGFWSGGGSLAYGTPRSSDFRGDSQSGTNPSGCDSNWPSYCGGSAFTYHGRFRVESIYKRQYYKCCQACCEPPVSSDSTCGQDNWPYGDWTDIAEFSKINFYPYLAHPVIDSADRGWKLYENYGTSLNNGCALRCPTYGSTCSSLYSGDPDYPCETCDGTEYTTTLVTNRESCEAQWICAITGFNSEFWFCTD